MGEALIVRRGGSNGGVSLGEATYVDGTNEGGTASTRLDPSKTYLLIVSWADVDSMDSLSSGGAAYLLKDGVVSTLGAKNGGVISSISYSPTTNRVSLGYLDFDTTWIDIYEMN